MGIFILKWQQQEFWLGPGSFSPHSNFIFKIILKLLFLSLSKTPLDWGRSIWCFLNLDPSHWSCQHLLSAAAATPLLQLGVDGGDFLEVGAKSSGSRSWFLDLLEKGVYEELWRWGSDDGLQLQTLGRQVVEAGRELAAKVERVFWRHVAARGAHAGVCWLRSCKSAGKKKTRWKGKSYFREIFASKSGRKD